MTESYIKFWGKAGQAQSAGESESEARWHPAACHMLDVAAVALQFLEQAEPSIPGIAKDTCRYSPSIAFIIALHDVGKFSRPFQQKRKDLWPSSLGAYQLVAESPRHDTAGFFMLRNSLSNILKEILPELIEGERAAIMRAVCGHHGRPPEEDNGNVRQAVCKTCVENAEAFIKDAREILRPAPLPVTELDVTAFAWWLAGLTVVADWIGSNEDWFVYAPNCNDLAAYWPLARQRAKRAVAAAGVLPISPRTGMGIADLLPAGAEPSPMQTLASTLDLGDHKKPALVLIEDQTGSGKTEAALLLAHRLMVEKSARGLFIALPTMATANALYGRLEVNYQKLFLKQKPAPSLVLAHGKRMLSERFLISLRDGRQDDIATNADDADETATAQCAGWIAGDRRRTFLADCGVGTIDQALHAVLPTRHAPLRLFGLRDRVLIIDEAHAYDTYMQQELFRLIEFQTRLGGSMIILSATLPQNKRQEFVRAFGAGALCSRNDYPLITIITRDGLTETSCKTNEKLKRNIIVTRLPDVDAAIQNICLAAAKDAAIGWIRNTVDDAIAAQTMLAEQGIKATLFHARFAMGDRQVIEERVQDRFGKDSVREQRAHVIVGTQVMEQSLDIDFDILISDLAPIDLLLQRAGRLWRHQREARPVAEPHFFIIAPDPVADPPKDWLKDMRGTEAVYQHPALLWRSARAIFDKAILALPADVRGLVEAAYDENAPTPQHLQEKSDAADGKDKSAASIAWMNLMEWAKGYMLSNGEWLSDVKTPTRLSEPSRTFRLAVMGDAGLQPWYHHEDLNRAWALSEISVPCRKMVDVTPTQTVSMLKQSWSRFDQDIPVLVMKQTVDGWHGEALGKDNRKVAITYNAESGLEYT